MTCGAIRYLISFMVFLAFALDSATRSAMNLTILAMVSNKPGVQQGPIMALLPDKMLAGDSMNWDATIQGYVLNSVYAGILFSLLPAGHLAESFSLKWVLGYGIFFMSVLTMLTPLVAQWNVWVLILLRVIAGLSVGVIFPSANSLISRWSPKQERTVMITVALQGYSIGPIFGNLIVGPICKKFGWEYVFYLLGGLGVVWSVLWYLVVASSPEKHRWISEEERHKILAEREGNFDRNRHIPWKKILTSGPVIVLCFRTFTTNIQSALSFTYMPTFFSHMYKIDLTSIGWINGISNFAICVVALISSALADRLLKANYPINVVRKTFSTLAAVVPAIMFILLTQLEPDFKVVVIMLITACTAWGLSGGSDTALPIDLAAEYAGAVGAAQTVFGTLAQILVPSLVGQIIEKKEDFKHWNVIFLASSVISIFGSIVFLVLGTAEHQDWRSEREENDDERPLADPL